MTDDCFAAVSTPYGRGGIAVIRACGRDVFSVCEKVFRPKKKKLRDIESSVAVFGEIFDGEEKLDEGIATVFRAPRSYTGEDTVEISCHGGILITQRVLEAVLNAGARMAQPGEFTKCAFVNGKLSLSQAEAVIGVINAENTAQLKLFSSHVSGKLRDEAEDIRKKLLHITASIYAYIDFPDEDMTDITVDELKKRLCEIKDRLSALCSSYRAGQAIAEGIKTVIAGKPNVGKSSLLNLLLGRERAIVTDIAGTTRDTLEESVCFGGITLRLIDTAGIRSSSDRVEQLGVNLSKKKLSEAGLILAVFDASRPLDGEDYDFLSLLDGTACEKVAIINKSDISCTDITEEIKKHIPDTIPFSCKDGEGKDELEKLISSLYISGDISSDGAIVANARQHNAVSAALHSVEDAIAALNASYTQDIAGMDIEQAISSLSMLDSRAVSEDVVDEIFHSFCVGK